MGLYTRFAATCLASNDCVLIQDDALELPTDSLRVQVDIWHDYPDTIHGVFGRAPKPDGSYARNVSRSRERLTDYELASRSFFFLWASVPNEELLDLATKGEFSRPEVLKRQTLRMLRDERAISLATDFAGQMLGFADFLNFTGPDEQIFPQFTAQLRQAMY